MKKEETVTQIGQRYATAYAEHYRTKNLRHALELYQSLVVAHPDTHEAEYSRAQISNIAKSLVPNQELVDAQISLALAHLKEEEASVDQAAPAAPIL